MKTLTVMILSTSLAAGNSLAETVNFDDATPGAAPPGWTATKTGKGEAKWTIEKDDTAEQAERAEAIRRSHISDLPQERHEC